MFDKIKLFVRDRQKALRYRMVSEQRYYTGHDWYSGFTYYYMNTVSGIVYMRCRIGCVAQIFNIETGNWDALASHDFFYTYNVYIGNIENNPYCWQNYTNFAEKDLEFAVSPESRTITRNKCANLNEHNPQKCWHDNAKDIDIKEAESIDSTIPNPNRLNTFYLILSSLMSNIIRSKESFSYIINIIKSDKYVADHLRLSYPNLIDTICKELGSNALSSEFVNEFDSMCLRTVMR